MSFSQDVKKEIQERLARKSSGFTFSQNANNIMQAKAADDSADLVRVFLEKGSVNDPKAGYHLEMICDTEPEAGKVAALMAEHGFNARISVRKGRHIVYLKDRETIADFLGYLGAVNAMMEMENSLILKDVRNTVNRRVNFEAANIERTVGAAVKDIEDIRYIEAHGGLKQLPKGLREIAELRMEDPETSLKTLGEEMDPPLGKSGVNHRLRRIREYADRLRQKEQ